MKTFVLNLLFVLSFFSQSCICHEVPSALDVLASVASSRLRTTEETPAPLNLSEQEFAQKLVRLLLVKEVFHGTEMLQLRERYGLSENYLSFLMHLLKTQEFETFSVGVKTVIMNEFQAVSMKFPEATALADYSTLNLKTCRALGGSACLLGNLSLLRKLVESGLFDFNADYELKTYKGNAIVLLRKQPQCLAYAIEKGLDLKREVRNNMGMPFSSSAFLQFHTEIEKLGTTNGLKRPLDSSSNFSLPVTNEPKIAKIDEFSTSYIVTREIVQVTAVIKPVPCSDFEYLESFEAPKNTLMSSPTILERLKRILVESGPRTFRKLIVQRPVYLERTDFLPMLLEVLNDNLAEIAMIYAVNTKSSTKLLDSIRIQFQNDLEYARFLFEFLKRSKFFAFVNVYIQKMKSLALETLNSALVQLDYSILPKKVLSLLGFGAVDLNSPLILTKVLETSVSALNDLISYQGAYIYIYSLVKDANILRILLSFKVRLILNVRTPNGSYVPVIYHFLSLNDPEMTRVIKEYEWESELIVNSLRLAQASNDTEKIEILNSLRVKE